MKDSMKNIIKYFLFFVVYIVVVSFALGASAFTGYKLGRKAYPNEFENLDKNLISVIDDVVKCIDDGNDQLALIKLGYIQKCPRTFVSSPNSDKMKNGEKNIMSWKLIITKRKMRCSGWKQNNIRSLS